ncbi:unnamed protein product [Discosporangium mesarthrocarpum]
MSRRSIGWVLCGVTCTGGEEVRCWTTCTSRSMLTRSGFYVIRYGTGVYLHPAENNPKPPTAQSKRYLTKYMILAAVARRWFDGKIGIGPIVEIVLAKRDSKNCKKGTPITKPATVNGERYRRS